jgi:ketosteroid isomerase-like protein
MSSFISAKFFYFSLACLLFSATHLLAQKNQAWKEIQLLLTAQEKAWNEGNIDLFMQGYWKSDSLKFVSKNGVTQGWENTYERYLKNYPDRATMGTLKFDIVHHEQMDKKVYFVIGKWSLKRSEEKGDVGGFFSLIFKKIKGKWLIVVDHTS